MAATIAMERASTGGCEIAVERSRLPNVEDGEFYWTDLVGLRFATTGGVRLGEVERMMETGANDVMVVRGDIERLIPSFRARSCNRSISRGEPSSSIGIRTIERWE